MTLSPRVWISFAWPLALALLVTLAPGQAFGGRHFLTKVRDDSMDLVVSLSFNPRTHKTWTRAKVEEALKRMALKTNGMAEGRLRLCKLYVYPRNRMTSRADMRLVDRRGRAHATINGLFAQTGQIETFTQSSAGKAISPRDLGGTMAHELGHYALGLYDEYRENGREGGDRTGAGRPVDGDVTLATIMGQSRSADALSTQQDYDRTIDGKPARANTAHWRIYQASAWDVLIADPKRDRKPAKLAAVKPRHYWRTFAGFKPPARALGIEKTPYSCFEVVWMEGLAAVVVIDRSGSVAGGNDPTKSQLARAKAGAKLFVNTMKKYDTVAVVSFSNTATTVIDWTEIDDDKANSTAKTKVNAAIDGIVKGDATGIDGGLVRALELITGTPKRKTSPTNLTPGKGASRAVVLVTDGKGVISKTNLEALLKAEAPVFPVQVSGAYVDLLATAAKSTGGAYYNLPPEAIAPLYANIVSLAEGAQRVEARELQRTAVGQAPPNGEISAQVSEQDKSVAFVASGSDGAVGKFTLIAPDGREVDPTKLPAGVTYDATGGVLAYRLTKPTLGLWRAKIVGGHATNVFAEVRVDSPLSLELGTQGGTRFPEPIVLQAALRAGGPVLGARVVASVEVPTSAAPIADLVLHDDGKSPDALAGDGVYSGAVATVTTDGAFRFSARADNPDGKARIEASAAHHVGNDDGTAPPIAISAFSRSASATVEARGAYPPTKGPSDARDVYREQAPTWGAIDSAGDVAWFKVVQLFGGSIYFVMTSQLVSSDKSKPMATQLSIIASDGTTVLGEGKDVTGDGLSWIQWKAPTTGSYYLRVSHPGGGTGRFAVHVSQTDQLSRPDGSGSGKGSGSGSNNDDGGGLCALRGANADAALPLLTLIFAWCLLGWRRRRR